MQVLLLTFRISDQAYALDVSPVIEMIPYVSLRAWSSDEAGVAGLLNYRGEVIPVIDMSLLVTGNAAQELLSSRIVVLECAIIGKLALLVEGATETWQVPAEQVQPMRCANKRLPCLGDVIVDGERVVQLIDTACLVTERLSQLFEREQPVVRR